MPGTATAILTWRDEGAPERRANLDAVLARLACMPGFDLIVVEQGPLPRPGAAPSRARTLFAYNPGAFHPGWGLNLGARATANPVLVFGDPDVLPPGTLVAAAAHAARGWAVVKPTRGRVALPESASRRVRAQAAGGGPVAIADPGAEEEEDVLCAGWFAMRRDAFVRVGGFDERFAGEAGRRALSVTIERLRIATLELDEEPAVRLSSPRAGDRRDPARVDENALLASIESLDDAALARQCEIRARYGGGRDKHRPRAEFGR